MKDRNWFEIYDWLPDPLSKEDNLELLYKAQQGDEVAYNEFVKHNIRLVVFEVTNKFSTVMCDKRDLVAVGNIGLMMAVEKFDFSRNKEFSTFASRCIDNEIRRYLNKNNVSFDIVHLEDTIEGIEELELKFYDKLDCGVDIESDFVDKELILVLNYFINNLPLKHRKILSMYYGFCGRRYTQQEIARELNCCHQWVSTVIERTLEKIRNYIKDEGFVVNYDYEEYKGKKGSRVLQREKCEI